MATQWNFGDILDAVEPEIPADAPAFIHGERRINWGEARVASNNLAKALIKRGAKPLDKVAFYMRNCPEYTLGLAAAFKARLTHVNVNYRYTADEVWYIFDNSDAQTVFYTTEFRDIITQIRPRLPTVANWVEISADGAVAPFAESFEALTREGDGSRLDIKREGTDQFFIYTGGTTGMPKGVMWQHHDLREITLDALRKLGPVPETYEALREATRLVGPGRKVLPAPPLMHGTGLLSALGAHVAGGCVITLTAPSFDPIEMLVAIDKHKPDGLCIVGDSFGKPLLNALNADPDRYDCLSVVNILSSGVMWSVEVKRGLLKYMPNAVMQDGFSSSEAIGMGASLMTKDGEIQTAKFTLGDRGKLIDENDQFIERGSDQRGLVALAPPNPLGYYKDPEKTARTFRVIDGVRYSIPGDWATVDADGTLTLLGRGNACINTAGEKVFPEEVEEALKTHPAIEDALVVGLADEKWGQSVTAVVTVADGFGLHEPELRAHVREKLAGYKVPKHIVLADRSLRASNGKADYPAARACAQSALGVN